MNSIDNHAPHIDFVLPIVDSTDLQWQEQYRQYCDGGEGDSPVRFRDWGWLRYWLRSIAINTPWVHRIFILSCNPKPDWVNADGERLVWLHHREFIPAEFLPTFNVNTIELHLHRIPGLSEHFVYFNDDTFINAPIEPTYYFRQGLPCDATLEGLFFVPHYEQGNWGTQLMEFCDVGLLKKHFLRREVVKGNWYRWYGSYLPWQSRLKAFLLSFQSQFFNFNTPHHERPLLKSVFEEVWQAEPDYLRQSCTRFREPANANVYLMRYWHLASNRFYPSRNRLQGKYFEVSPDSIQSICRSINDSRIQSLCLNDSTACSTAFFEKAKKQIAEAFDERYPVPCEFEISI